MHMIEPSCTINHLPPELLVKTFSYLEPKDLVLAERVSKTWQEAANYEILWRAHCESKHGKNYLASLANPNPKTIFKLPNSIKFFQHFLKQLSIHGKFGSNDFKEKPGETYCPEIHGKYLLIIKAGPTIYSHLKIIFDLTRKKKIKIPQFFESFRILKSTFFNDKQLFIVEVQKQLIISEFPFNTKECFEGIFLDVSQNQLFFASVDERQLLQFNLESRTKTFIMDLESPIRNFFASEFAHVASLDNRVIIFYNLADLSKKIELSDLTCQEVRVNQNWLIISYYRGLYNEGRIFFLVYDIANNKLHLDLTLRRLEDEWYGNIELCGNAFVFSRGKIPSLTILNKISIVDLETIGNNEEPKFKDLNIPLNTWHLSSFANRFFFAFKERENKICFTDFLDKTTDNLDLNLFKQSLRICQIIINGRFVVVEHYSDLEKECHFSYCDLLDSKKISKKLTKAIQ